MAHNGVLFLDELPEFPRNVLEVMRQPLEERRVTIARAQMTLTFPRHSFLSLQAIPARADLLRTSVANVSARRRKSSDTCRRSPDR
jgi:predicted ATPase with chaperone activity